MSDLFQGQTMTEAYRFVSRGEAHTFRFNFQPDKVTFYNLTQWEATNGNLPISIWFREQTGAGDAFQEQVIDAAGASFNFILEATNGFTVADTAGGISDRHATIVGITATDPVVVEHSAFTFQDDQIVRLTDLGNVGVTDNGMGQLNNKRFKIVVVDATHFSLKDVITGEPIDGTGFTAWVAGGIITLETAVISLNNPQVSPYSNINPYHPNPFAYDPIFYQLTAGTAVMGDNDDEFLIEVIKYGQVYDLGILALA